MLHILLFILKILGCVILAVLTLLFLLLAIVLFVPIRYRVSADKNEKIQAEVSVTWILKLVRFHFSLKGKKKQMWLKIAWKTLLGTDPADSKKISKSKAEDQSVQKLTGEIAETTEAETTEAEETDTIETEPEETLIDDEDTDVIIEGTPVEEILQESEDIPEEEDAEETRFVPEEDVLQKSESIPEDETSEKKEKEKLSVKLKGIVSKIRAIIDSVRDKIRNIEDTVRRIKKTIERYHRFLTREYTRRAIRHVKKEVIYLLKHIRPRKISGSFRFGLEDPASTGQVLGYLYCANAFLGNQLYFEPDFEEKVIEGEIRIKGHIRCCHFVKILLALLFDKNVRKTIKGFRKLRSS